MYFYIYNNGQYINSIIIIDIIMMRSVVIIYYKILYYTKLVYFINYDWVYNGVCVCVYKVMKCYICRFQRLREAVKHYMHKERHRAQGLKVVFTEFSSIADIERIG
jgi:hypothetical protein